MNRPELYKKTVDILYEAYFNDTLKHQSCVYCAVGNLVMANMGLTTVKAPYVSKTSVGTTQYKKGDNIFPPVWSDVFCTFNEGKNQNTNPELNVSMAAEQISSTGYPWQELAKIEYAFESADKGNNAEDYMFNGLVAVLEVLKTIHEVDDNAEDITRFKDHYQTRTCPA